MKKSGLNDSGKILVTAALWMAAISLFATAITLPMLPDSVTIVYKAVMVKEDFYPKYNNLLTSLCSVIPAAIILIVAALRARNKIISNFTSIMIFSIMLSVCMGGVTIYGITRQMAASGCVRSLDDCTVIAVTASAILSAVFAFMPMVLHSKRFLARMASRKVYSVFVCNILETNWNVGAYGFIVVGIFCAFVPGPLTFVPLALGIAAQITFVLVAARVSLRRSAETKMYDLIDS